MYNRMIFLMQHFVLAVWTQRNNPVWDKQWPVVMCKSIFRLWRGGNTVTFYHIFFKHLNLRGGKGVCQPVHYRWRKRDEIRGGRQRNKEVKRGRP